jgi:hypothetical protein
MADRAPNLRSSIYLGADGRWHGYVTLGIKDDGSPDRRHRSGKAQAEVTRKVQELERKRDQGSAGKSGRPLTVADWFETWLTTIAPRTVSQGTLDSSYEPKVRHFLHQPRPPGPQAQHNRPDPPDRLPRSQDRLEARQGHGQRSGPGRRAGWRGSRHRTTDRR